MRGKTGLDGCEMSPVGEALDRDDLGALNLPGQGEAGEFWHTVDHDRATATRAKVTSPLHAERADLVSENVQQHGVARRQDLKGTPVNRCSPSFSFRSRNH